MIDYIKRPRKVTTSRKRDRSASLAEFIAAGSTSPNRPIQLRAGQTVNLSQLARR
jgi:hypothetical protein